MPSTPTVPNAFISTSYHYLVFPVAGLFLVDINNETSFSGLLYFEQPYEEINLFPFLSTELETRINITTQWSYPAYQTIIVPALEPAPELWFEWVSGFGLVLWGLESDLIYDIAFDPFFDKGWFYRFPSDSTGGIRIEGVESGDTLFIRTIRDLNSSPSAFVALNVPPHPHNVETYAFGMEFKDSVFSYDSIIIYDSFKTGVVRQLYVMIRKHDASGSAIVSPIYPIIMTDSGAILPPSVVNVAFRNFSLYEYLELLVYSDVATQNQLSRQVIRPVVFVFSPGRG